MRLDSNAPIITAVAMSAVKSQHLIIEPKTMMVAIDHIKDDSAGKDRDWLNATQMNLYNLVLRMVDQIILHQIAHVPPYLGIRRILFFLDMWLFSLLDLIFSTNSYN